MAAGHGPGATGSWLSPRRGGCRGQGGLHSGEGCGSGEHQIPPGTGAACSPGARGALGAWTGVLREPIRREPLFQALLERPFPVSASLGSAPAQSWRPEHRRKEARPAQSPNVSSVTGLVGIHSESSILPRPPGNKAKPLAQRTSPATALCPCVSGSSLTAQRTPWGAAGAADHSRNNPVPLPADKSGGGGGSGRSPSVWSIPSPHSCGCVPAGCGQPALRGHSSLCVTLSLASPPPSPRSPGSGSLGTRAAAEVEGDKVLPGHLGPM